MPVICAFHCVATPLLASTLSLLTLTHAFEQWLLAASAVLAVFSVASTWRVHGRGSVWVLLVLGFMVWEASVAGWLGPLPEAAMSPVGGLIVAATLVWNGRLRHGAVCGECTCPAHPRG